jgi:hypothetical protein
VTDLVRNYQTLFAQLVRAFRHELQIVVVAAHR